MGVGAPLLTVCWTLLWTQDTFWNPLFFMGMWSGATFLMYGIGGRGYPGLRRHTLLLIFSVPLWWWFEVVNARVENWEYLGSQVYTRWEYLLLGSAAFSTVIPALDAAWSITVRTGKAAIGLAQRDRGWYAAQVGLGLLFQGLVFLLPTVFFPFVWVAPFLVVDGLVGYSGGRSLVDDLTRGEWRLVAAVATAGLLCGFLWEFWNFWSVPKWTYHVPLFSFGRVFEMPVLGYGGYVPFAWSIYQLLHLRPAERRSPGSRNPQVER